MQLGQSWTSSRYLHLTRCGLWSRCWKSGQHSRSGNGGGIQRTDSSGGVIDLHVGACGGVRECLLHACGAVDGVVAHESVNPRKPDVCVSNTVNYANRLKTTNQEKEMSRVRNDSGNGVI